MNQPNKHRMGPEVENHPAEPGPHTKTRRCERCGANLCVTCFPDAENEDCLPPFTRRQHS